MTEKKEMGWNFDNSYAHLPETFYTLTNPTPVQGPKLVKFNTELAASFGLCAESLRSDAGAAIFAGNEIPKGALPLAQAYAGHQFGHFTMLGDGRAILLGEQITPQDERFDIQLKGAGRTPYSRGGDGRAALGPMLREYIMSEAMHALRIPTTRSLAVVTTGEPIYREEELEGAILTRVASSHLRVGTFQYATVYGTVDEIQALANYTIERHFPEIESASNPYLSLLQEVIKKQAKLIAKWQLVGFIHGVMNTDNMTINGETIDYGPCAFMDSYDPATVFSSIDHGGRYAYGNQPVIANWNLTRFAETLLQLLHNDEDQAIKLAEKELKAFPSLFYTHWTNGMREKLGLFQEEPEDKALIDDLLNAMKKYKADYTNTFLALTFDELDGMVLFASKEFKDWHKRWMLRLETQEEPMESAKKRMRNSNPAVIPRNHRVEEALEAVVEKNDYRPMDQLLQMLEHPYEHTKDQTEYAKTPVPTGSYRTYCGT
ncbi:YdiU family protein [Pseudogracilibacillus auburnensis]|uniref:Protein nucleotidyltransferase YdiU n=1 Tax=Pseudogracilibacillus auburnensis TaxID=1494959 RepID=A0A2V3VXP5_9BACI|nr:YdiU family protein [Pseudogracilibacillus auburnensis]PXW84825.1 uncharacterized protein YdiU (UPF0061 family) [Pseudogracilibacillus auburnensis]